MAKLELKHIATYLPYNVKIQYKHKEQCISYAITNLTDIFYIMPTTILDNFVLYLKPLSDLSNFTDLEISEHSINTLISEKYNIEYGVFSQYKNELGIELGGDADLRYDALKSISFDVIITILEELAKGHYDIYGLIEKGLAKNILELEPKHLKEVQK